MVKATHFNWKSAFRLLEYLLQVTHLIIQVKTSSQALKQRIKIHPVVRTERAVCFP